MPIEFTAHNIRFDDGTMTRPGELPMSEHRWFIPAKKLLDCIFVGDKSKYRVADLGCLEGGYSVEFARMGFQVVGIEVRESNFAACEYVKSRVRLPNLTFVHDDAWNLRSYGAFDAVFCCGLLYHLERPKAFLQIVSEVTNRMVILQTHFAVEDSASILPQPLRRWLSSCVTKDSTSTFRLSPLTENEGLRGRWYREFVTDAEHSKRESRKWASWDNKESFWLQREYLLQAISDVGFDMVLEQFDGLGSDIAGSLTKGYYKSDGRGTFVGIKSKLSVMTDKIQPYD